MILPQICIKRPVFATVLSLIILTLGMIFFTKLQIRELPDIDPPIITVSAVYEGADASYMEKEITTRIEKILKTTKNLDFMSSSSGTGYSSITLSFKLSADIEVALNDIRSKIAEISYAFPKDMRLPSVSKFDSDNFPSLWLSVSSNSYDKLELTRIVENNISSALERLSNVGSAKIYGGSYYSMRIEPDIIKMYEHKISPVDIEQAVLRQNKDYPAGAIKTDASNFTIRLTATLNNVEELENVVLRTNGSTMIKLKDIAKISLSSAEEDVILRYNGNRAMAIGLVKQSKSNVIDLSDEVKLELKKIVSNLPKGVNIDIAFDGATSVRAAIKAVFITIFESLILVVVVVYLFLASGKVTLIPFVTIPISLIATFSVMYFFGFSINTFTLLAMILAIGLVVDDAIVMLESVFRHYELGNKPFDAAIIASKEISFAIISMTITLAAVFLPVGFIEGFLGKLFVEFAWTLAFCVLFSGFIALTLTPMMCSRIIGHSDQKTPKLLLKFNQFFQLLQEKYLFYLELGLNNKKRFFLISASSIILMIIGFRFVDKTFVPEEDSGFLQVIFKGPEGSSVKHSEQVVMESEQIFASYKDILGYFAVIGNGGSDSAFAFVPLKDWKIRTKSQKEIRNSLNQKFANVPGMSVFATNPRSLGGGGRGNQIEFNLQTSLEYDKFDQISQKFIDLMRQNEIFVNVERDFQSSTPTLDIIVDRDKAYLYGANLDTIGTTVQYLIAGRNVGDFRIGSDIYDINLRYNKEDRSNLTDINKIFIKTVNNNMLPLSMIADVIEKITVKYYSHYNNSRSIAISSDLNPKYQINDAIKEINKIADSVLDNSTTRLEYLGQIKQMKESNTSLLMTFVFALVFIYLVLAAQFESFSDPLIILLSVPFSITGGVLALLIFSDTLNMYSNIGLITLIGLITKNSIMIVEFANQLRRSGVELKQAVLESARLRFRPILMTSIATICGAVPLAVASGAGAAARSSIGLVIVGGMLIGTIFTIFVIPVLYQFVKKS